MLFCCGTYKYLSKHLKLTHLGNGVHRVNNDGRLLIDFYHPSNRKGYRRTFDRLSEMLGGVALMSQ